ncbi:type II secretion system protein [Candidatus Saccharibacteria bacterium]|nr:type II secretion system protein [Candidatus Saccharibacteria bacterium]
MKNLLRKERSSGFTIIEVMIVLAIAGLIMVIVFIAVPQLQRNQRDNARQNIANRIKAEIETYAGNNQGQYPFQTGTGTGTWNDFYTRYVASGKVKVTDPSTGNDVISASLGQPVGYSSPTNPAPPDSKGEFVIAYGAKCDGELWAASGLANPTTRTYALMIGLDRDETRYCVDNG